MIAAPSTIDKAPATTTIDFAAIFNAVLTDSLKTSIKYALTPALIALLEVFAPVVSPSLRNNLFIEPYSTRPRLAILIAILPVIAAPVWITRLINILSATLVAFAMADFPIALPTFVFTILPPILDNDFPDFACFAVLAAPDCGALVK